MAAYPESITINTLTNLVKSTITTSYTFVPHYADVVHHLYQKGFSPEEISRFLGIDVEGVKAILQNEELARQAEAMKLLRLYEISQEIRRMPGVPTAARLIRESRDEQ